MLGDLLSCLPLELDLELLGFLLGVVEADSVAVLEGSLLDGAVSFAEIV